MNKQRQELAKNPAIIIATPGRLIDHIKRINISLGEVQLLVLDEADRMLDMGFIDDVKFILQKINRDAQIAMYTATLSREVMDISWVYQKSPVEIRVEASLDDKPSIKEYYIVANGSERIEAIHDLMGEQQAQKALVFVNMKQSADITARKLRDIGFTAESLQGDMQQSKRTIVMNKFRTGDTQILVGTDVAARGLDVENVDLVFNYDLPLDSENYVHRIGRTGRAGRDGMAISFVAPGEKPNFDSFCRRLRINPQQYPWTRPETAQTFMSAEKEDEIIQRIRNNSQYLKKKTLGRPATNKHHKISKTRDNAPQTTLHKNKARPAPKKTKNSSKPRPSSGKIKHREF